METGVTLFLEDNFKRGLALRGYKKCANTYVFAQKPVCRVSGMENWNQDHPERYSNFCRLYVKFQGHEKWPWTW